MGKEEKRNKIELYSLKQAEYLKEHYAELVINKPFGTEHIAVIDELKIIEHKKDKCELKGFGYLANDDSVIIRAGIKSICRDLGLEFPKKILQGLN
jgi:hypothetical protein